MTRNKAPYAVGGRIRLLHMAGDGATVLATIPVTRVTRLNDGQWRIEAARSGGGECPTVAVTVDEHGYDRHGYVIAVTP